MLQGGSLAEWKIRMGKDGCNQAGNYLGSEGIERLGVLFQNYKPFQKKEHHFHKYINGSGKESAGAPRAFNPDMMVILCLCRYPPVLVSLMCLSWERLWFMASRFETCGRFAAAFWERLDFPMFPLQGNLCAWGWKTTTAFEAFHDHNLKPKRSSVKLSLFERLHHFNTWENNIYFYLIYIT